MERIEKGFTHNGMFHADDVCSAALLRILFPGIQIERGSEVPENYNGIVFDIGCGKYDHHQNFNERRENGAPYAAFGKLWREYGNKILNKKEAEEFDLKFVQKVDYFDNTGEQEPTISMMIKNMNPSFNSKESVEEKFEQAVSYMEHMMQDYFNKCQAKYEATKLYRKL